jgi:hypothetical protein
MVPIPCKSNGKKQWISAKFSSNLLRYLNLVKNQRIILYQLKNLQVIATFKCYRVWEKYAWNEHFCLPSREVTTTKSWKSYNLTQLVQQRRICINMENQKIPLCIFYKCTLHGMVWSVNGLAVFDGNKKF